MLFGIFGIFFSSSLTPPFPSGDTPSSWSSIKAIPGYCRTMAPVPPGETTRHPPAQTAPASPPTPQAVHWARARASLHPSFCHLLCFWDPLRACGEQGRPGPSESDGKRFVYKESNYNSENFRGNSIVRWGLWRAVELSSKMRTDLTAGLPSKPGQFMRRLGEAFTPPPSREWWAAGRSAAPTLRRGWRLGKVSSES